MPSEQDRNPLPVGAGVEVTWVVGGNGHGPLGHVARGIVDDRLALDEGYGWVAGETVALRDVRKNLRRELGMPATRFKVVGYWTPIADWDSKYPAFPASVQRDLESIWQTSPRAGPEAVQVRFDSRLDQLGLWGSDWLVEPPSAM